MSNKSDNLNYCTDWYKTRLGEMSLDKLDDYCTELLSEIFGYYAIELGVLSGQHDLLQSSRIAAGFSLLSNLNSPATKSDKATVISSIEQLPIATDNVDLVIASHVLETSDEPHQVLREIDRVLVPEGHCILIGFNPLAISQIVPSAKTLIQNGIKRDIGNNYKLRSAHRVKDWFSLLGFEVLDVHYMGFRPNINNKKIFDSFRWLDQLGEYVGPVLGKLYMFHVKKQVMAMRPYKKVWKAPAVLSGGKVALNRTAQKIRRENLSNL